MSADRDASGRIEAVAVTGGNGEIGRAVLRHFADRGYRTVNLSRGARREEVADAYLRTDLLDAGEVYGSLAKSGADAVVHLGTLPRPDESPGHVTFESNAMTTYHVLEAAQHLGVGSVCLASSLSALGAGFDPDPVRVEYLPVDESHPLTPRDPYALGKRVLEVTAEGIARRNDGPRTVSALRFPLVVDDEAARRTFADADRSLAGIEEAGFYRVARNTLFAYLHVEDAAALVSRAVEADFRGYEVFWAAAPDTTADAPSAELAREAYPGVAVRRELDGYESLVSAEKARARLGWEPTRSWRDL
ncbi:NAD-dependent epimerase/dehydratase family protein [Halegenticoccus soli]|uniref:NAD-dependent epimerase/dehydratase family protein n=1 Tax=Halegenticoccus soli TaxID=1985678 RepID=UPI000C6D1F57|nr:NAD(P)-dependent oxidoreductase [Halegenticoccus soli]